MTRLSVDSEVVHIHSPGLRKAKALLLAGNLDLAAYERAAADAEALAQEYEAAKAFLTLGKAT